MVGWDGVGESLAAASAGFYYDVFVREEERESGVLDFGYFGKV